MKKSYTYRRAPLGKKPIGLSLLLAQFFIIVSYAFFIHTHVLDDGTRVVHAHFFSEKDVNNTQPSDDSNSEDQPAGHQHTCFSYSFLTNINLLFKNRQVEFNFFPICHLLSHTSKVLILHFSPENFSSLRAPPVRLY